MRSVQASRARLPLRHDLPRGQMLRPNPIGFGPPAAVPTALTSVNEFSQNKMPPINHQDYMYLQNGLLDKINSTISMPVANQHHLNIGKNKTANYERWWFHSVQIGHNSRHQERSLPIGTKSIKEKAAEETSPHIIFKEPPLLRYSRATWRWRSGWNGRSARGQEPAVVTRPHPRSGRRTGASEILSHETFDFG